MRRVALASAALAFAVCPPNGWQVPLLLWHASRLRLAGASARQLHLTITSYLTITIPPHHSKKTLAASEVRTRDLSITSATLYR